MPKILLVEDSTFLRIATERILIRAKYEVCTAADGEEALRVAAEKKPDLILLDMMLPKLSGPDVLKRLKSNPETADIAVVVLSGLSQKNAERLQKDGALAYLEKSELDLERAADAGRPHPYPNYKRGTDRQFAKRHQECD
jgi:CheY-like chemotaxis protein